MADINVSSSDAGISNHTTQHRDGEEESCFIPGVSQTLQRDYFYYTNVVLTPVNTLLGIWIVLSNGLILIAILKGGMRIRPGFLLLCSLTLTDLLWGGLVTPVYLKYRVQEIINSQVCALNRSERDDPVMVASFFLCLLGTVGSLAVISLDRYLAVAKAMWYKVSVKLWHACLECFGVWLLSIFIITAKITRIVPQNVVEVLEACYVIAISFFIVIVQGLTLYVLNKHNNSVAQNSDPAADPGQGNNPVHTTAAIERKLTVTTSWVAGELVLVLIPCAIVVVIAKTANPGAFMFMEPLYFPIASIISSINPVLYHRRN
ncbi:hypothetical protein ACROYT_G013205, partial [Oculina patagonica]